VLLIWEYKKMTDLSKSHEAAIVGMRSRMLGEAVLALHAAGQAITREAIVDWLTRRANQWPADDLSHKMNIAAVKHLSV
jgi:hypothetical protein